MREDPFRDEFKLPPPPLPEARADGDPLGPAPADPLQGPVSRPEPRPARPETRPAEVPLLLRPVPWETVIMVGAGIAGGVCLLFWLVTLRQPPGLIVLAHYAALLAVPIFAAVAISASPLCRPAWRGYFVAAGVFVAVAIVVTWSRVDTYVQRWSDEENNARFVDYHWRAGGDIYYRELDLVDDEGRYTYSAEGPKTASNKNHGEWRSYNWDDFNTQRKWYWYGEEITEGEWHLRN